MADRHLDVVIVGGSSGIGLSVAKCLSKHKVQLHIASRSDLKLEKAKSELGNIAKIHILDATREKNVKDFFESIGHIDHLITTIKHDHVNSSFARERTEDALQGFNSKFWGQYYCAKHCLPYISKTGSITLTSGIASTQGFKGFSTTSAINGAIESLVRTLAIELSPIRINAICPGFVERFPEDTERLSFVKTLDPQVTKLASLDDITASYLSLLNDPNITGKIIEVT